MINLLARSEIFSDRTMEALQKLIPSRFYEVLDRASICTPKQIMILSKWDIKKLTNLSSDDIYLLKSIVADYITPNCMTADILLLKQNSRISCGCEAINSITNGGFRTGTITEIFGESGSGKSQIGIQTAAYNDSGSVFICTEELFPVKRLEQIKQSQPTYTNEDTYGTNIYIEHVTEPNELQACVKVRLPRLLSKNKISLIVVDSIAAPYRSDTTNYVLRADDVRELAMALMELAQQYNIAVICINQVTTAFDGTDNVLPSLGLAWSNMVSTRLRLRKTSRTMPIKGQSSTTQEYSHIRELSVVFAPDLANKTSEFVITSKGIAGVSK